MILGALIFVVVWCLIALLVRRYPETIAGYNTMSKHKLTTIDIEKIGRWLSNSMYAGVPFALIAPLMPSLELYSLLLCWIPCGIVVAVGIYVNVCKKKFEK